MLTVSVDDLKPLAPQATKNHAVVLTYTAHLDPQCAASGAKDPADNYVYLAFTEKPDSAGIGRTVEDHVQLLTWGLNIHKVDGADGSRLAGAVFTVQDAQGLYLRADGTTSDEPVELAVDESGLLALRGIDAGTYTLTEVKAPEGYTRLDRPATLEITSTLALSASSAQARIVQAPAAVALSKSTGDTPAVEVRNNKPLIPVPSEPIPQTGDGTWVIAACAVAGAACCSAAYVLRRANR